MPYRETLAACFSKVAQASDLRRLVGYRVPLELQIS